MNFPCGGTSLTEKTMGGYPVYNPIGFLIPMFYRENTRNFCPARNLNSSYGFFNGRALGFINPPQ